MQTAKQSVSEPQVGDIWRDKVGHHNLITDIYDDGEGVDRKSTRLNSSHVSESRMPSSA